MKNFKKWLAEVTDTGDIANVPQKLGMTNKKMPMFPKKITKLKSNEKKDM